MSTINVLTLEDATLDTFVYINEASRSCKLDARKVYLQLLYGDKILTDEVALEIGGNAANVAAGAVSLGLTAAVFGTIGDDERGVYIKKALKQRGVITRYLKIVKNSTSNNSIIITFKRERTILTYHPTRGSNPGKIPKADWYYLSQTQNTKLYGVIIDRVKKSKSKLAFNPGTHMIKQDHKNLIRLLKFTDLLFVNKEETAEILGVKRGDGKPYIKMLLSRLKKLSKGTIIVTDGPQGAYAYDGNNYYYIKPFPSKRFEPTGAGDSFASGFLSAVIKGRLLSDSLVWGSLNSAHVIQKIGSQVGLLSAVKIARLTKKNPRYKTTTI